MIKKYKDFLIEKEIQALNEIGEGTAKAYKWKLEKVLKMGMNMKSYKHLFYSDKIDYVVSIFTEPLGNSDNEDKQAGIVFYTDDKAPRVDYVKTTNLNELYNVMATVMDIVLNFVKTHTDVKLLYMSPSKAFENDNRRANLYMAYIKKNISKLPGNWEIDSSDLDEITIYKLN